MKYRVLSTIMWWGAIALVVVANLIVMWRSLTEFRFWEDEAYNATVPLNVVRGLGYSSDALLINWPLQGVAPAPFDSRISTGPTVLLPVTLIMQLASWFGVEMWGQSMVITARIVPLAYWALLLVGLFLLGRRIGGRWGALLAAATPLLFTAAASNSPIQGPADLLGEIPMAAILVWALIVLRRRPWLAGLLFGLAIQTKYIALLAAPALVVALLIYSGRPLRQWWRTLRVPIALTIVPTLLVEISALIALGPRKDLTRLVDIARFLVTGGPQAESTVVQKVDTLMSSWLVPTWVAWSALLIGLAVLLAAAVLAHRNPSLLDLARNKLSTTFLPQLAARRELLALVAAAALGLLAFVGWWSTARHTPLWVRHAAPGVYAYLPILAAYLPLAWAIIAERLSRKSEAANEQQAATATATGSLSPGLVQRLTAVFSVLIAAMYLFGAQAQVQLSFIERWQTLEGQHAAATVMREGIADHVASTDEWIAARPWGPPVSIAVMTGHNTGLFDQPTMSEMLWISDQSCEPETPLASGSGYVLCPPTPRG